MGMNTPQSLSRQTLGSVPGQSVGPSKRLAKTFHERIFEFKMPNYGAIEEGLIYRCSYPQPENYDSIKYLRINTVITLVGDELPETHADFLLENQIRHHQIAVPANKDGVTNITPHLMLDVLKLVTNRNNYPLLIHCNRGKHRTGCVTACFRKMQGVSTSDVLTEYVAYSYPKQRPDDIAFIESFDPMPVRKFAQSKGWTLFLPPATGVEIECPGREERSDSGVSVEKEITGA